MLRFEHVSLSYGSQKIIDDISFEIQEGQMAVLIGSSGCGKTTTLKMINRLIEPTSGKIYINGKDIAAQDRVELRRHIGYVIQQIGLFPNMTVAQNICVVPNLLKYSKEACDKIVHELLELVNLPYEQYAHKYPSEMSGGQQQRIGILRALAASPPIVLMDEPFSALDPMTRRTLQQEVRSLQQKLNKTFVFVTHDMEEALDLADVIIFMDHGRIVQMAPPEEMLARPASGLIQDFLGKFINTPSHKALTAADFMRTGVYTVSLHRGTNECVRKMQRYNVDTLIGWTTQAATRARFPSRTSASTATWLPTSLPWYAPPLPPSTLATTPRAALSSSSPAAPAIWWCWARRNRWRASSPRPAWPLPWRNSSGGDGMGEFLARNAEALIRSIGVHLFYTLVSVAIGFVLGLGLGILLSRFPRQARFILPLLSLFNTIPGVVFIGLLFLVLHIQPATVLIALSIYAMFPVLKNTFTGLLGVDAQYKEAAQGCGMSPAQQLLRVELPLAMPTIIGGLRMSMVYTVSWAVLAAMIGLGGLGTFIYQGVQSSNNALILLGAVPAALLAFLLGGLIDLLQKHVVPKGLRKGGGDA